MSSLSQALSIALTGLRTNASLITLASDNISNAQTDGYTAKKAIVTNVQNGSELGGSTIAAYQRAFDQALTRNYNESTSSSGYYGTLDSYLAQVQTFLDSTSSNPTLSNDIAQFSAAWSQYASEPESNIQQQNLLNTGRTLANDINAIASQIGALDTQVQTETGVTIDSMNTALTNIANLNNQIQAAVTGGQPSGNLEDQRDQLVNQIASYVGITVQQRSNNMIALYTPSGTLLVDGATTLRFTYDGTTVTDSSGNDVGSSLTGGSLQAQLSFRDTSASAAASTTPGVGVISKLRSQLSKLVDSFTNSSGSTPSAFATAYSAAATASLAGTQNGSTVDSAFFTVTNNGSGQPDPSTFRVNPDLLDSTSEIPQTNAESIASSFNATANYAASGLSTTSVTYAELGTAILSNFQQAANTISGQSDNAKSQQTYYKQTLTNETGVNMDTELANLVAYQNSYAATAHVITTVNQMMTTLMSLIG